MSVATSQDLGGKWASALTSDMLANPPCYYYRLQVINNVWSLCIHRCHNVHTQFSTGDQAVQKLKRTSTHARTHTTYSHTPGQNGSIKSLTNVLKYQASSCMAYHWDLQLLVQIFFHMVKLALCEQWLGYWPTGLVSDMRGEIHTLWRLSICKWRWEQVEITTETERQKATGGWKKCI
jgi:hypothetical protein